MPDTLSILQRLLAVSGETGHEEAILQTAYDICTDAGLPCQRCEDGIWVAIKGEKSGVRLLFNSHLDTVPAGEGWKYPAQQGILENDWLYGRGAVDARGSCAAMLAATTALQQQGFECGELVVALSIGEEGNDPSLPRLLKKLGSFQGAVVGEPTNLDIAISQRGLLVVELTNSGKQGHAARENGTNAIHLLAGDLINLKKVPFERSHPTLGTIRVTPTRILAGVADNVTPPNAKALLDIRTTPSYSNEEILMLLQGVVSGNISVCSDHWIPCETASDHPIAMAARRTLPQKKVFASDAASDWAFLQKARISAIKLGPGNPKYSHQPDERISIEELEAGTQTYLQIASQFLNNHSGTESNHV